MVGGFRVREMFQASMGKSAPFFPLPNILSYTINFGRLYWTKMMLADNKYSIRLDLIAKFPQLQAED